MYWLFQLQRALQEFDFLQDAEPDWCPEPIVELPDSTINTPLSTPQPSPLIEFPQDEVFNDTLITVFGERVLLLTLLLLIPEGTRVPISEFRVLNSPFVFLS